MCQWNYFGLDYFVEFKCYSVVSQDLYGFQDPVVTLIVRRKGLLTAPLSMGGMEFLVGQNCKMKYL